MTYWSIRLALLAALSAGACSSYNRGTIPADSGATQELPPLGDDAPPGTDVPVAPTDLGAPEGFSCARLCRRIGSVPGCTNAQSGCTNMCASDLGRFPSACMSQLNALFACVESTPLSRITCAPMAYPYQDCMTLYGPATTCARNNP